MLEFADDAFVVSSFSKYFNMTGWRLGWLVAPDCHVRDLEKLAQNLYISPSTPSQRAALACFRTGDSANRRSSEGRRSRSGAIFWSRRCASWFAFPSTPTGGFFVYADCSRFADDSDRFCRDVLKARPLLLRRAWISARIAPGRTCVSPTR